MADFRAEVHGMDRVVEIQRQRRVYDGFVTIDEAVLRHTRFAGGWTRPLTRIKVERGDSAAAIVTSAETGRVILVEQFRYPTVANSGGWIVETVAGLIDDGETAEEAARREVREEIGYEPRTLEHIATFYASPGGGERAHLPVLGARHRGRAARPGRVRRRGRRAARVHAGGAVGGARQRRAGGRQDHHRRHVAAGSTRRRRHFMTLVPALLGSHGRGCQCPIDDPNVPEHGTMTAP
jgi:ADP-ribose pyrophosphatase